MPDHRETLRKDVDGPGSPIRGFAHSGSPGEVATRLCRAALILALVVGELLAGCDSERASGVSTARAALMAALGPVRLTPGRLAKAPYAAATRAHFVAHSSSVLAAARALERGGTAPADLAGKAIVRLAAGRPQEAVDLLARAARSPQAPAWIRSDLVAARLEFFRTTGRASELVEALSAAYGAADSSERPPVELLFNRAATLETFGLRVQATSAWEEYLRSDPQSDWRREAAEHLRSLRQPTPSQLWAAARKELESADRISDVRRRELVSRYPRFVRLWLQEELFPAWADAEVRGGGPEAAGMLARVRALAHCLAEASGDPLLDEAAAAAESSSGAGRRELARAFQRYAAGRVAYEASDIGKARPAMAEAERLFARAGNPFEGWATFHVIACDYYRRQGADAVLARARALCQLAHGRRHGVLEARAYWVVGAIRLDQGRASQAAASFRAAAPLFERAGERDYSAWIASLLANCARGLGDSQAAWDLHLRALAIGAAEGFTLRLPVFLDEASRTAAKAGDYVAGLRFQSEALALLGKGGDPLDLSEAYWWRSIMYHLAGDDRRAAADIDLAERLGRQVKEPSVRDHNLAGIAVTAGTILRGRDPAAAVASLSRALELYRPTGFRLLQPEIHLERARALLALGKEDAAEADLDAAMDEYERQRFDIAARSERTSFFAQARDAFELAAERAIAAGDVDQALQTVERGKALSLLDALAAKRVDARAASAPLAPLTVADIRRGLPAGTTLVEYLVTAAGARAWAVTAQQVSSVALATDASAADSAVDLLRESIRRRAPDLGAAGERLARTLLAPLGDALPENGTLVVVADRALYGLPFAALPHPRTHRPLGETLDLVLAPSARAYLLRARQGITVSHLSSSGHVVGARL